jgi:hypothetical protein
MRTHSKQREIQRSCLSCGNDFTTGSSIKLHCSPECRIKAAASAYSDPAACWEWDGSRNPATGYGQLSSWEGGKRKLYTAHRVSFRAFHGEIPAGQQVLHKCDNRPCFNPAHLFIGSQLANMKDMIDKGRAAHRTPEGSEHHASRITEDDARAIRASTETLEVLSQRYGMSKSALSTLRSGKTWRHI